MTAAGAKLQLQSPKFKFLRHELDDAFSSSLLKTEWRKRVRYQIRKQLIFDAIEYRDFNDRLSDMVIEIRHEILNGGYRVRSSKRYLVEKSKGLCRQMTLVHPRDLLVLERLSRSFYFELLRKSPSKSAYFEPDDGNFTKGFKQSDFQYGSFASWKRFQSAIFGFSNENNYIVISDVANFYDFINFQHLRNIISSLANIRESILDLLIYILNRLTWTPDFMPLSQTGMPQIETSATRVLANALLYEVDRVCEDSAVENYARFMDDIDVGVDSIPQAKSIIRDIDLTLQARQLRLNSSKTKILTQKEAFEHFCISQNLQLSRLASYAERKRRVPALRKVLTRKYERWLARTAIGSPGADSAFRRGNGPKIHKFILRLIYDAGGSVPEADLLWLVKNDPGMRSTALRYLSASTRNNTNIQGISNLIFSNYFIDDGSIVDITMYTLHSRFRKTYKCTKTMRGIVYNFEKRGDIGLYCAIFIASRFLHRAEILALLRRNEERIRSDFWLCRATAGIAPRFIGHSHAFGIFLNLVRGLSSEDAEAVLEYILNIVKAEKFDKSLLAYVKAKNNSYPQKLYYPKILILLAAVKNADIAKIAPTIYADHPNLKKDPYYRSMGFW